MLGSRSTLNPFQSNKQTNKFDREFDKYIHHLSNERYADSDSLGEDQEYELEYMRSHRDRFKYI
jgi:membrane-bound lytic murein transglycosylase MltF